MQSLKIKISNKTIQSGHLRSVLPSLAMKTSVVLVVFVFGSALAATVPEGKDPKVVNGTDTDINSWP